MKRSSVVTATKPPAAAVSDVEQRAIRLRLMELIIPAAAKVGLNDPNILASKAHDLEQYVHRGYSPVDTKGDPPNPIEGLAD